MLRRKYSSGLLRPTGTEEEDVNPREYLTNLSDAMLVLVVGLLVALVAHYNIDLANPEEQIIGKEIVMDQDGDGRVDAGYEEAGTVYKDAATGQYYMVAQ